MTIGTLLIINLLTVPFIYEAETAGRLAGGHLRISEFFRLENCRKSRWFYGYLIFLVLFVILVISPSRSGKEHLAPKAFVILILIIQCILWGLVIYRNIQIRRSNKNVG